MEIFGIPVVVTVNDILGLGGVVICVVAMAVLFAAMLVLEIAKQFMEWRRRFR